MKMLRDENPCLDGRFLYVPNVIFFYRIHRFLNLYEAKRTVSWKR
jgi:hypothetical protein